MGQGIISRSNPGNSGDKVGDIRITTRNTLGEKWALCNGAKLSDEHIDPDNPKHWSLLGITKTDFEDYIDDYMSKNYDNFHCTYLTYRDGPVCDDNGNIYMCYFVVIEHGTDNTTNATNLVIKYDGSDFSIFYSWYEGGGDPKIFNDIDGSGIKIVEDSGYNDIRIPNTGDQYNDLFGFSIINACTFLGVYKNKPILLMYGTDDSEYYYNLCVGTNIVLYGFAKDNYVNSGIIRLYDKNSFIFWYTTADSIIVKRYNNDGTISNIVSLQIESEDLAINMYHCYDANSNIIYFFSESNDAFICTIDLNTNEGEVSYNKPSDYLIKSIISYNGYSRAIVDYSNASPGYTFITSIEEALYSTNPYDMQLIGYGDFTISKVIGPEIAFSDSDGSIHTVLYGDNYEDGNGDNNDFVILSGTALPTISVDDESYCFIKIKD